MSGKNYLTALMNGTDAAQNRAYGPVLSSARHNHECLEKGIKHSRTNNLFTDLKSGQVRTKAGPVVMWTVFLHTN